MEPKGNKEEKMLNSDISLALGVHVHEFDDMKDEEVAEWRRHLLDVCQESVTHRYTHFRLWSLN